MNKKIIFHLPYQILLNHASGTQIRPLKMKRAFQELGYEVDEVMGSAKERKKKIKQIEERIRKGIRYDFMYSESSTDPTLLTEPHHFPTYPRLDFSFFSFCQEQHIPIGLFYRDIYWNFPFYGDGLSFWKRTVARWFYRYDLRQYSKYLSTLYLPSKEMLKYMPIRNNINVVALPPGCEELPNALPKQLAMDSKQIHILYVGGVGGLYTFDLLLASVSEHKQISLTICCRKEEWVANRRDYEGYLSYGNVKVVHQRGNELKALYAQADIVSIFIKPSLYRSFAMPIKLFEYLQNTKPMISTSGNVVADFIAKNDIGWVIPYKKEALDALLNELLLNTRVITDKKRNMLDVIKKNTWKARANQVAQDMNLKR